jgi:hypothetical protein
MGASQAAINAITLSSNAASCLSPREADAGGDCYTASFTPPPLDDAGTTWGGVYWQSPANNWGAEPGKLIAPGATKVTFYAAGAAGGEQIQFCTGGMNATGPTTALPYSDTLNVKPPAFTLTTQWTQYSLSLSGLTYTDIIGGFCWVAASTTTTPIKFYVDDIQFE